RELETDVASLRAKARSLRPVLTLDVIDHGALFPCEQRWDHQADAFAAPSRRERQDVFGAFVPEVVQMAGAFGTPAADEDAMPGGQQSGVADIAFISPARGTVQVLGLLCKLAGWP